MSEVKFEGQVALVTGASRGIGAAIAQELADADGVVVRAGGDRGGGLVGGVRIGVAGGVELAGAARAPLHHGGPHRRAGPRDRRHRPRRRRGGRRHHGHARPVGLP